MTKLDPGDGYATLINTFVVDPEKSERLLAVLHEASATMRKMNGFVSANLHVSADRKRVVNYVQWRTRDDFETMLRDPEAKPHMDEAAAIAEFYNPVFYTLRYSDGG